MAKLIGNGNEVTDVSNTITSNVNNLNIIVNENFARIIKNENDVQNLNHTLNDLSLNTTSSLNFERLELAENNIMLLNNTLSNTVNDFKNDIKTNTANIQSNEGKVSSNQAEIFNFKTSVGDLEGIFYAGKKILYALAIFHIFHLQKSKIRNRQILLENAYFPIFPLDREKCYCICQQNNQRIIIYTANIYRMVISNFICNPLST